MSSRTDTAFIKTVHLREKMRSGYVLFTIYSENNINQLTVDEHLHNFDAVLGRQPAGNARLGGNCQSVSSLFIADAELRSLQISGQPSNLVPLRHYCARKANVDVSHDG